MVSDQRDFSGNTLDTLLLTASSRTDLNNIHSVNDGTRKTETTEDDDPPVSKSNYDRLTDTHHCQSHCAFNFFHHNRLEFVMAPRKLFELVTDIINPSEIHLIAVES